jgi:serine/threonine-protein kinase
VCLAIQLAHSRGVVHRDLKPSNIMLGDYGEVYVLDWGVARVITDTKRTHGASTIEVSDEDGTTAGAILGTPGYMSPEQVRGEEAGIKADVYSLGAILFEILAGEPLHPRGEAALASTLTTPQEAPARRVAERKQIPPELDGVCFEALAEDPAARPSARELADRVQAYLDGDRDLERRRALASEQLKSAQEALATDDRATAMRRAGRALALDPESTEAASLVTSLLLEPPEKLPPELSEALAQEERAFSMSRSRQGMWAYLSLFVFWVAIPFMHIKSWAALLSFYGLLALGAVVAWRNSQRGHSSIVVTLVMTMLVCVGFTRVSGPFMLTPIVTCAALMQLSAIRQLNSRMPIIVTWTVLAVMLPFVLEWSGLVHHTYGIRDGAVYSASEIFDMEGSFDELALVVGNLVFTVFAGLVAVYITRRRMDANRAMTIQAWHLRQLLPNEKRWQTRPR